MNRAPKLLALSAGLVSALGFAPLNWWPLTLACIALLLHQIVSAAAMREAMARGYWFGVGHFVVGLNWIAGAFQYQDAMPKWLGWIAVVLLSLYLSVYPAMAAGLAWRWGRARFIRFVPLFAASWIVTEYLRATLFTGFAWNPLGVVLLPLGRLAQAAPLMGTYGLSGLAVLIAGGVLAADRVRKGGGLLALAAIVLLALVPGAYAGGARSASTGPLIRVVQPNIGQQDKHDKAFDRINFEKLAGLTGAPGREPRLILWPEAAVPEFLEEEQWAREIGRAHV